VALTKGSLQYQEDVRSKRAHTDEGFDPDWIDYAFTAWGHCTHPSCKQNFALAGKGGVTQEMTADDDWGWEDYFSPLICYPMPDIFEIPNECPDNVVVELRASFTVFWSHQAAAASRLRVALELLLDHLGVQKHKRSTQGQMSDLSLHARINIFARSKPTVAPQLMALKWLGNTGSHDSVVSKGDLLDAFEIMEHALGELIDERSQRVAKLAKKLTKKHSK
jgi:hypothetical protein